MIEVDRNNLKMDTIYGYYQILDDTQYLAFIRITGQTDVDFLFSDVCNYFIMTKQNLHYTVRELDPEAEFEVSKNKDDDIEDTIINVFELTQEEIEKHVLMEIL